MPTHGQRKSKLQERRVAQELGGRVQPASGATRFEKGDVRVRGDVRAECKTTSKPHYVLKLKELVKIQKEAISGGLEVPVMQIEFQNQLSRRKIAVLDTHWLRSMLKDAGCTKEENYEESALAVGENFVLTANRFIELAAAKEGAKLKRWIFHVYLTEKEGTERRFSIVSWDLFLQLYRGPLDE